MGRVRPCHTLVCHSCWRSIRCRSCQRVRVTDQWATRGRRITEEDIQRAKNQLDVAAAKNHVLPRTAVAAFSQVARFSDEWSGKSLRRMQPGLDGANSPLMDWNQRGRCPARIPPHAHNSDWYGASTDKERVLKELNQPAIPSDAIVKPRAPAANFGRASEKKTTAVTSQSTDLEPLTVKYDAVIPRVVGSAWKPAASKAEDNPSTQAIRAMRVGPGAYDVAKAERLLRPRSSSVVTCGPFEIHPPVCACCVDPDWRADCCG
jgi:hypothetical protein